jgi:hypothetical protein
MVKGKHLMMLIEIVFIGRRASCLGTALDYSNFKRSLVVNKTSLTKYYQLLMLGDGNRGLLYCSLYFGICLKFFTIQT